MLLLESSSIVVDEILHAESVSKVVSPSRFELSNSVVWDESKVPKDKSSPSLFVSVKARLEEGLLADDSLLALQVCESDFVGADNKGLLFVFVCMLLSLDVLAILFFRGKHDLITMSCLAFSPVEEMLAREQDLSLREC